MIIINSSTQTAPIDTQLSTSLLGSPSPPIQAEQKQHGGKTRTLQPCCGAREGQAGQRGLRNPTEP